ncbi:MAG: helix-turn-helix domain-containing protein [Candidatus Thiodiazotropha lotti]
MVKADKSRNTTKRSICPIASALDILGDKWSLLVVRDLFAGKATYSEIQSSPERIPTNILANRLARLTDHQIVEKKPYQQHPVRYEYSLTPKGTELGPILKSMVDWGEKHIPGTKAKIKMKR